MKNLVSICVKSVLSVAEPLRVVAGGKQDGSFGCLFVTEWLHCIKGSEYGLAVKQAA